MSLKGGTFGGTTGADKSSSKGKTVGISGGLYCIVLVWFGLGGGKNDSFQFSSN